MREALFNVVAHYGFSEIITVPTAARLRIVMVCDRDVYDQVVLVQRWIRNLLKEGVAAAVYHHVNNCAKRDCWREVLRVLR